MAMHHEHRTDNNWMAQHSLSSRVRADHRNDPTVYADVNSSRGAHKSKPPHVYFVAAEGISDLLNAASSPHPSHSPQNATQNEYQRSRVRTPAFSV